MGSTSRIKQSAPAGATDVERDAATLTRWILKERPEEVHVRTLIREVRLPGLRSAEQIKKAADLLVEADWLRARLGLLPARCDRIGALREFLRIANDGRPQDGTDLHRFRNHRAVVFSAPSAHESGHPVVKIVADPLRRLSFFERGDLPAQIFENALLRLGGRFGGGL